MRMRMFKTIVPAMLALLLLVTATPSIAAQGAPPMPEVDFEGLEKMYGRTYSADPMAMIDTENPEAKPSGWFMLITMVLEFDSEDSAAAGLEAMQEQAGATGMASEDLQLEDVELDLDFDHTAQRAEQQQEGVTTTLMLVTAQDAEYVYAVSAITFGEDPTPVVEPTMTAMREAEAGDGEEMFNADGTSEGGLWAKLPGAEDVTGQVDALTEVTDTIYFPAQQGTPAA